jgi:hypothetical protein
MMYICSVCELPVFALDAHGCVVRHTDYAPGSGPNPGQPHKMRTCPGTGKPPKETRPSIEVDITYEPGDRSAGIQAGWGGEDTCITIENHGLLIVMSMIVDESTSPLDWTIDQIDVTLRLFDVEEPTKATYANFGCIQDPTYWRPRVPKRGLFVRDLPADIRSAVCAEWEKIQIDERQREAELEQAAVESERAQREFEEAERRGEVLGTISPSYSLPEQGDA